MLKNRNNHIFCREMKFLIIFKLNNTKENINHFQQPHWVMATITLSFYRSFAHASFICTFLQVLSHFPRLPSIIVFGHSLTGLTFRSPNMTEPIPFTSSCCTIRWLGLPKIAYNVFSIACSCFHMLYTGTNNFL